MCTVRLGEVREFGFALLLFAMAAVLPPVPAVPWQDVCPFPQQ
ncbi:hypothetical protein [Streptomyces alkaliterrae]|nr:hypothetical protein [Streptomyces alkaliterrae]